MLISFATPRPLSSTSLPCSRHTRSLASARLRQQRRQPQQQQQQQRRHLPATAAKYSGGGGGSGRRGPRRGGGRSVPQLDPTRLLQQYGLPTLGLLVAASLIGPLVGGLVFTALSLGVAIAAGAAALSISWIAVPLLIAFFGMPALMAGGMAAGVFATIAGGALLLPSLIQLALVGGGLWLGALAAQQLFYGGGEEGSGVGPNGTIDVEAEPVDDWKEEIFKEKKERDAELREFDDLLRRRDEFKNKRGPY